MVKFGPLNEVRKKGYSDIKNEIIQRNKKHVQRNLELLSLFGSDFRKCFYPFSHLKNKKNLSVRTIRIVS